MKTLSITLFLILATALSACSKADTNYFTDTAYDQANQPKKNFTIEGATHVYLQDKQPFVEQVTKKLSDFFRGALQ